MKENKNDATQQTQLQEEELKNVTGGQDWNRGWRLEEHTPCPDCEQFICMCHAACVKCGRDSLKRQLQDGVCVACRLNLGTL